MSFRLSSRCVLYVVLSFAHFKCERATVSLGRYQVLGSLTNIASLLFDAYFFILSYQTIAIQRVYYERITVDTRL